MEPLNADNSKVYFCDRNGQWQELGEVKDITFDEKDIEGEPATLNFEAIREMHCNLNLIKINRYLLWKKFVVPFRMAVIKLKTKLILKWAWLNIYRDALIFWIIVKGCFCGNGGTK